jgi:tellurium resistance protein TerD
LQIKASGINSTIHINENELIINRPGGLLSANLKGNTIIPYQRILNVQAIDPPAATRGYIYVQLASNPPTLSFMKAASSPNAIFFDRKHMREYVTLRKLLLEKLSENRLSLESDPASGIKCPNCHSTQITANQSGYSYGKAAAGAILIGAVGFLVGGMGSKKILVTCLNCGHSWQPGQH